MPIRSRAALMPCVLALLPLRDATAASGEIFGGYSVGQTKPDHNSDSATLNGWNACITVYPWYASESPPTSRAHAAPLVIPLFTVPSMAAPAWLASSGSANPGGEHHDSECSPPALIGAAGAAYFPFFFRPGAPSGSAGS